jgi:Fur family transcriptional regulator, ferric uptake regulator
MNQKTLETKYRPLLQKAGLKVTPERLSILDALSKEKRPLSVKNLKVQLKGTGVDQATIYRNMGSLAKGNVVRLVNFQHDHNHYELVDDKHHHHLICESCGKVVDVSTCNTDKVERQIKKIGGFATVNSHALEFFGLCKACVKK